MIGTSAILLDLDKFVKIYSGTSFVDHQAEHVILDHI